MVAEHLVVWLVHDRDDIGIRLHGRCANVALLRVIPRRSVTTVAVTHEMIRPPHRQKVGRWRTWIPTIESALVDFGRDLHVILILVLLWFLVIVIVSTHHRLLLVLLLLMQLVIPSTGGLLRVDLSRWLAFVSIIILEIRLIYFLPQTAQVRLNLLRFHRVDSHAIVGARINDGSYTWIVALSRLAQLVDLLIILVKDLSELPQHVMVFVAAILITTTQVALIKSEELLFENIQLVLDVLNISAKRCLNIDVCAPSNLCEPLLDRLPDFLGELESCHTVLDLHIGRVEVDTEDDFGVSGEHRLRQNLRQ